MDITKIFAVLCGFLLIICLTLSITCLVVMRNAVAETSFWQDRAESLVNELDNCVEAMKNIEDDDLPVLAPGEDELSTDNKRYCLRSNGENISIYDRDGYLIQKLDINVSIFPIEERTQLAKGIWTESWKEMQQLVQDYEQ